MTYSLNTLNASAAAKSPPRTGAARFGHEVSLLVGLLALIFWLLALVSYSAQDPSWSSSGVGSSRMVANWAGRLGAWLADGSYFALGFSVWWCVAAAVCAWFASLARWMRGGEVPEGAPSPAMRRLVFWVGLILLVCASAALEWSRLYRFESYLPGGHGGGVLGYTVGLSAMKWLGFTGSGLVSIVLLVVGASMVFRFSWGHVAEWLGGRIDALVQSRLAQREVAKDVAVGRKAARERAVVVREERTESEEHHPEPVQIIEPVLVDTPQSARVVKERQKPLFTDMPDSKLPMVDLLDGPQQKQETVSSDTLEMTSRLIEKKLKDFGVEVRVVAAMPGPVITRYEIEPATGVKGSQIVGLAKDLARSLSLVSIRVVETIPGKNYMALELPNAKRQSIRLSEILGSQIYHDAKSMLTMGLGKDIVGNPVVADLAKMPHVLVAGTTGSGKSVGINAMILSLLYKAEARDVRLLMIDPKMLEMSVYEGIPHLLAPVVTDMKQAAHGLNWCVAEMERRYKLMSKLGVRNLAGYNTKIDEAKAKEEFIYNPFSLTPEEPEPLQRLPHIVVVIDELADLMMVVGKKIEELIARLAQKARAAGIHLILATQRPSVDVITGLIKANIPTRMAFQVASKVDSRLILEQMGAETLLGQGDMLYKPPGSDYALRVHGADVSPADISQVTEFVRRTGKPDYVDGLLEGAPSVGLPRPHRVADPSEVALDPLYDDAVARVRQLDKATVMLLQSEFNIGATRAIRLLDSLELTGVISAADANGHRKVLAVSL